MNRGDPVVEPSTRPRAAACVDVVVIWAGLSGLVCADRLRSAGADVVVVEARDRAGGRTHSVTTASGAVLDLGAQWVGAGHDRVRALAAETGTELVAPPPDGGLTLVADGTATSLGAEDARSALSPGHGATEALARLDGLSGDVDPREPWAHPQAADLDGRTFGAWLADEVSDGQLRAHLTAAAEGYFAAPVGEVSLLHALVYARSNGGFDHLLGAAGDPASQEQVAGGAQTLALGLAARLGERVRLGHVVRSVQRGDDHVVVRSPVGSVTARTAVLAIPPPLTAAIAFTPALPWERRHLVDRIAMGSGLKVHVVYPEPWWRTEGLSAQVLDLDNGMVVFDATRGSGPGVLVAFPSVRESRVLARASPAQRRDVVLQRLTVALGVRAGSPLEVDERMWAWEPLSGGEVGVFGCGAWSAFGPWLRAPIGRLLFAGTETSPEYMGQMEGALRAGERAAAEALTLLGGDPGRTRPTG